RFQFLPDADPFRLSRGDRQRLALASILACHPEFLLLDEPTTGLDYRECMQLLTMMQELHQKGTTILMITHDMEIVQEFAQRVLVMTNGRLVADGATGDVMRETKTLKQASVMPSQMQELALELGDSYDGVYSVETMLARIDCLRRRRA
ncbi:MAG TPA: energy-coupling factor ABC transporter ATP-binding protein, partial [Lachnospiraceae bacterium]|nr:energy-coupling factor ABC transporter ATP-binding protein [Lachnospiraceae bacterium]